MNRPNTIGALPIAVARDIGCTVAYTCPGNAQGCGPAPGQF
ncbi:hypothetical protein ACIPYU_09495 [Paenarthrobacter nicotinovorans]